MTLSTGRGSDMSREVVCWAVVNPNGGRRSFNYGDESRSYAAAESYALELMRRYAPVTICLERYVWDADKRTYGEAAETFYI